MIDVLVYLFENYHDFSSHPQPEKLARTLSAEGFEDDEITAALIWLAGLKCVERQAFSHAPTSTRVFTAEEQARLGGDCLGFVSFLEKAGVVSPALRELIIDQGLLLDDDPVPLDKFKVIVLMVLWSREQPLDPLIIEELLAEEETAVAH